MSAPPSTSKPIPGNLTVRGGIIAGIAVLCAALFANAIITLVIVTRNAGFAFKADATQPSRPDNARPETRPEDTSWPSESADGFRTAKEFMNDVLKNRNFGKAWDRGTDRFKREEDKSAFSKRMEAERVFRGYRGVGYETSMGTNRVLTVRVRVTGVSSDEHYVLELVEENGSWRVDTFEKDR